LPDQWIKKLLMKTATTTIHRQRRDLTAAERKIIKMLS
jgi:hypothetical protein